MVLNTLLSNLIWAFLGVMGLGLGVRTLMVLGLGTSGEVGAIKAGSGFALGDEGAENAAGTREGIGDSGERSGNLVWKLTLCGRDGVHFLAAVVVVGVIDVDVDVDLTFVVFADGESYLLDAAFRIVEVADMGVDLNVSNEGSITACFATLSSTSPNTALRHTFTFSGHPSRGFLARAYVASQNSLNASFAAEGMSALLINGEAMTDANVRRVDSASGSSRIRVRMV
jgi:hypothetical protein